MGPDYSVSNARGLGKKQLGGVIFGANKTTIDECLSKQLFGLPGSHFRYVKKIKPNLPLFLFNYTGRTLHGIFEAASSGQMNIDPFAWISEGSQRTQYPAQVQIRVKLHYEGLTENQFKPIIADNYYTSRHFWFELDHAQTKKLSFLLSNQALADPRATLTPTIKPFEREHLRNIPVETVGTRLNGSKSFPSNLKDIKTYTTLAPRIRPLEKESVCHMPPEFVGGHLNSAKSFPSGIKDITTCKTVNEKELITTRLKDLAQKRNLVASGPPPSDCKDESDVVMNNTTVEKKEDICYRVIAQLFEKVKELMACKSAQSDKIIYLERKIASMEQNLAQAQAETKNLNGICNTIEESISDSLPDDSILLIGGYDGVSWLSSLDCYSPSQNLTKSLSPMLTERCYAAVSKLDGELFVFGGGTRGQRFNTVESFDPVKNRWTFCPPLNQKNENLAGATVKDRIYALGGGINGVDCYSSVEMLDFDVGAWIPTRSMLQKRFALAAAELHGALYAVGGYDGSNYLSSAERFDPRERSWKKIESMTTVRGCPSMVVLNEKLFVLGGYDGNAMASTVEIYDPRRGSWMIGEPMNHPRGFSAAAVAKDCVYIFGGLRNDQKINETSVDDVAKSRLDTWISTRIKGISRARVQSSIKSGLVHVNDRVVVKASHMVRQGDKVECTISELQPLKAEGESVDDVAKTRLDTWISTRIKGISRARVQSSIKSGLVHVNDRVVVKASHMVRQGDKVECTISELQPLKAEGEDIPLDIVYEDDHVLVVNKPAHMVVHPAPGNATGTLVNGILHHCSLPTSSVQDQELLSDSEDLSDELDEPSVDQTYSKDLNFNTNETSIRPGIVHRLDKGTSGLLVVAKDEHSHAHLSQQFKEHTIQRIYISLTCGVPFPASGRVDIPIGRDLTNRIRMTADTGPAKCGKSRHAASRYRIVEILAGGGCALVEWRLETGRTHQIRAHAKYLGIPLMGDEVYGGSKNMALSRLQLKNPSPLHGRLSQLVGKLDRPCLHALTLGSRSDDQVLLIHFDIQRPTCRSRSYFLLLESKYRAVD
ncbi:development/cell death domain, Galactose oxidase, beta-propeller [Artemisia annua]|uniref:Development/cell death domain, Galactose oxidase, beta-propeller n=1 Tax=Artemisia annua TaxID=35608 RepID=A0A2U1PVH0_ARTAN|nr:development/cell death domain, Galactose oxidase, beta-propeller [Artemisia annua]